MVHGRVAYIVACGPRTKGSKPGSVSAKGRPATSAAVYSGLMRMPSGVTQSSRLTSPSGALREAALRQASRSDGGTGGKADCDIVNLVWRLRRSEPAASTRGLDLRTGG